MKFLKSTVSAETFSKKGEQILGVFTKTKNDLVALNNEQLEYTSTLEAEIDRLQTERSAVKQSVQENASIVKKIEDFLK